jgi:phage terminase large subunit
LHEFDRIRNGLDFGYSNDPNAFVRLHYDKKNMKIYVFKGWQAKGLTNPEIAALLLPVIGKEPVFCDSAEPKSIAELQVEKIDARPVKKGPDSLKHGIKWLQKHEIIVDLELQELINELTIWQWKKDKNGDSLPIPEDKDNHSIDGIRYATETEHSGFFEGLF